MAAGLEAEDLRQQDLRQAGRLYLQTGSKEMNARASFFPFVSGWEVSVGFSTLVNLI